MGHAGLGEEHAALPGGERGEERELARRLELHRVVRPPQDVRHRVVVYLPEAALLCGSQDHRGGLGVVVLHEGVVPEGGARDEDVHQLVLLVDHLHPALLQDVQRPAPRARLHDDLALAHRRVLEQARHLLQLHLGQAGRPRHRMQLLLQVRVVLRLHRRVRRALHPPQDHVCVGHHGELGRDRQQHRELLDDGGRAKLDGALGVLQRG
mmetsp:Transcript_27894/g.61016  ORF Transcript_27894/g.61016 Transcript_27894/m.61016 type:complete len:209 (-) Transcript_27894:2443-3069(-)